MKTFVLGFVLFAFCFSASAQVDYNINADRKVKVGYNAYPQDFTTKALGWSKVDSKCIEDAKFGNWFALSVKGERVKFTIVTGGRFGDLENPELYLGEVREKNGTRSINEIACIQHTGSDGKYSIEGISLKKENEYFVLLKSSNEGAKYAIEITDDFVPAPVKEEKSGVFQSIFGRVFDKNGKAKGGVEVSLLNEGNEKILGAITDQRGFFKFEKLPSDETYIARIEAEDTDLKVELFLVDAKGVISNRATKIGDRLYAFGADSDGFPQIDLLTEKDFKLNVSPTKIGVVGRVVDKETYLFGRPSMKVGLYSKNKSLLASSETDSRGMFSFVNLDNAEYEVRLENKSAEDYAEIVFVDDLNVPYTYSNSDNMNEEGFFGFEKLPTEIVTMKRDEVKDTKMKMPSDFSGMQEGEPIILKNILFASGSAELLTSSYSELDRLASELKTMKSVHILVSGHTDNVGSPNTNLILSEHRAKSVVDYLSSKGVDEGRLTFKGYGSSKPIANNDSDEGRKQNRRVEFVVVNR